MRVLVDTNVVLDVLLQREPWVSEAAAVWRLCSEAAIAGYVSASSFTDIYYVARRHTDRERARIALRLCLDTFAVCPVDQSTLEVAYTLAGDDFEDNLQIACSLINGFDYIVTRNIHDFKTSTVPAVTADQLLQRHSSNRPE
jgi:predicted nucleic acid-binding protein